MAFTRHQHHVVLFRLHHGVGHRFRAAFHHLRLTCIEHAGQNIVDNRPRLFGARVIVSNDHDVGKLFRDSAHQRTFTFVAVAAAAEDAPQLAAAVQACRLQRFFQRVRRMGIIYHHGRFTRRAEHFHTAAHRL